MKYADARPLIKTGDCLIFSNRSWNGFWNWLAQLVRLADRTEYSHVGMAWCEDGRVWVIEATRFGLYPQLLSRRNEDFYWIRAADSLEGAKLDAILERVGDRYGWMDAVRGWLGRLVAGQNDSWQCAEFYAWARGLPVEVRLTPSSLISYLMRTDGPMQLVDNPKQVYKDTPASS